MAWMALLLLGAAFCQAQPGKNRMEERIAAFKVNFFTQQLQLSPEESQKFWPLYNQYEKDKQNLRNQYRLDQRIELMSDEEVAEFIDQHLEFEEKMVALKRDFFNEIKGVLPIRKVAMIPKVEQRFKRALLEEMRKRRDDHPNRRNFNRNG